MPDQPEPNWSLLPHNAEGFFELDSGYDRKDLKRSYNRLIRRFKPEKHPTEFQRIRAAFEELDNRLRYGRMQESGGTVPAIRYDWAADESSASSEGTDTVRSFDDVRETERKQPDRSAPKLRSLAERIKSEPAEALYAELKSRTTPTPFEFYALALLSDVVEPDKPAAFAGWLLRGLKAHRHEPGLTELLYTYFRQCVTDDRVQQLLRATSKVVRDDRFFFLTEPLWDRLLTIASFEVFQETLDVCEANLRDHRIAGRLTFYIHILKSALWTADEDWIARAFAFVEENHAEIPGHLEYDLELLFWLRDYRNFRGDFLNGDPIRSEMNRAIVDFSSKPEVEADRSLLECQLQIASDADAVVEAFPISQEGYNPLFLPWSWISSDLAERVGRSHEQPEPRVAYRKVYRLLEKIERKTDGTGSGMLWSLMGWGYLFALAAGAVIVVGLAVVVVTFPLSLLGAHSAYWADVAPMAGVLVGVVALAAYWVWLKPKYVDNARNHLAFRMARRCYNRVWRRDLLQFVKITHFPVDVVENLIEAISSDVGDDELTYSFWVLLFLRQDFGIAFYGTAQQFMH